LTLAAAGTLALRPKDHRSASLAGLIGQSADLPVPARPYGGRVNLLSAIEHPAAPRKRPRRWPWAVGCGVLVLLAGIDLAIAGTGDGPRWPVCLVLALGLAAVLWPAAGRPAWLTPQLRTAVPAAASAALTGVSLLDRPVLFGPAEGVLLLCLLVVAIRTCESRWVVRCAGLDGVAIVALPLRYYKPGVADNDLGSLIEPMLSLILLVVLIAGLAGYLRVLENRRRMAVIETRRGERLAMAADLHDFVAHHVTGILVQTQMARMLAVTEPGRLDPVLAGIEDAAREALTSMRRTVGILREGPETPAGLDPVDLHPAGDLTTLADLVEGCGDRIGMGTVLIRDPTVPLNLPHEVQAAAYRVVQESLTNVLRHAADATKVAVSLTYDDGMLRVAVRDNGRGSANFAQGGGFGLVGLTERVSALDGELRAGPHPHDGWEVAARLPAALTRS
jgi:signal transduction histidine kinase